MNLCTITKADKGQESIQSNYINIIMFSKRRKRMVPDSSIKYTWQNILITESTRI